MFKWLFRKILEPLIAPDALENSHAAAGAEIVVQYPTCEDLERRFRAANLFRPEAVSGIAALAEKHRLNEIVRSGTLLSADQLISAGINVRRKIGSNFADAVIVDVNHAAAELERIVLIARSRSMNLYNLGRFEEAGITECEFLGSNDERSTDIERLLSGKRMTITEARDIIDRHEAELARGVFTAVVNI